MVGAYVEQDGDRITVDGKPVEMWVRGWWRPAPAPQCDHAPSDNPRYAHTCRKCGRRLENR